MRGGALWGQGRAGGHCGDVARELWGCGGAGEVEQCGAVAGQVDIVGTWQERWAPWGREGKVAMKGSVCGHCGEMEGNVAVQVRGGALRGRGRAG